MDVRKIAGAAVLLGLAAAGSARAEPVSGLYVGAGAGYNLPLNVKAADVSSVQVKTLGGFVGVGSVGWGFGNGLRAEVEGNWRNIRASGVTGALNLTGGGTMNTAGVLVNALYDIPLGQSWISPYVGAGVGYAWTTLKNQSISAPGIGTATSNGTQGRFATQAILGAAFPVDGVPGLAVTAEYRFMAAVGSVSYNSVIQPGGARDSLKLSNSLNNSFLLGVRYAFNAPAPAPTASPTPVPAAAPARSYLVFFDWDKATLTDRARAVIKEAADNAHKVQVTRIEVSGYTDTSGTAAHNMALSIRRAQAVAAELVKNGVARNAITAQGFGDTRLLVPTGPGVREPQNRRVDPPEVAATGRSPPCRRPWTPPSGRRQSGPV